MIAAALALALLAGNGPGGMACIPVDVLTRGAAADGAPVRVWKGEAAPRAFAALRAGGYDFPGEAVMAIPTAAGHMVAIVDQGAVCHIIMMPAGDWPRFVVAVEGLPV